MRYFRIMTGLLVVSVLFMTVFGMEKAAEVSATFEKSIAPPSVYHMLFRYLDIQSVQSLAFTSKHQYAQIIKQFRLVNQTFLEDAIKIINTQYLAMNPIHFITDLDQPQQFYHNLAIFFSHVELPVSNFITISHYSHGMPVPNWKQKIDTCRVWLESGLLSRQNKRKYMALLHFSYHELSFQTMNYHELRLCCNMYHYACGDGILYDGGGEHVVKLPLYFLIQVPDNHHPFNSFNVVLASLTANIFPHPYPFRWSPARIITFRWDRNKYYIQLPQNIKMIDLRFNQDDQQHLAFIHYDDGTFMKIDSAGIQQLFDLHKLYN